MIQEQPKPLSSKLVSMESMLCQVLLLSFLKQSLLLVELSDKSVVGLYYLFVSLIIKVLDRTLNFVVLNCLATCRSWNSVNPICTSIRRMVELDTSVLHRRSDILFGLVD